jgi:hypothetical protein
MICKRCFFFFFFLSQGCSCVIVKRRRRRRRRSREGERVVRRKMSPEAKKEDEEEESREREKRERERKRANQPRLDHQDATNVDSKGIAFTIRSVFIIDPKKTIRLILSYPASTGRNSAEVLRVVDSLQTGDKHRITTPINWIPGDDVIVHPSVKNEEAKTLFPEFRIVKPYLRFTPLPKESTSAAV